MSCEECFKFFNRRGSPTPCSSCPKPVLEEANEPVWQIFNEIVSQARVGGMGGVLGFDLNTLPTLLAFHQIPQEDWYCYYLKLTRAWSVALKHWNKKEDPPKKQK